MDVAAMLYRVSCSCVAILALAAGSSTAPVQDADCQRLNLSPDDWQLNSIDWAKYITYDPWKDGMTIIPPLTQDAPPIPPNPPIELQLDDLIIDISHYLEPKQLEDMRVDRMFDLDGDGVIDMQLEWNGYRGPLSTYGSNWFMRAMPHCRMLRGGEPFLAGERVGMDDLSRLTNHARLFSVGGSLRYPERHMREFSGGPWYNTTATLVVLVETDDRLIIAQVELIVCSSSGLHFFICRFRHSSISMCGSSWIDSLDGLSV